MSSRKTLKSVSVEGLKPTITLTPVIESCGEGCRIHHIKSDSIARDGRDTFVPLRHVSKQKRRIFELEEENDKLVDVLHEVEAEAVHAYRCLQQDCETTTNSSEHFFKKWWHAECECDQLKAENAKLRERAAWMYRLMDESCAVQHPYAPEPIRYDTLLDVHEKLRELGIEVG